MLTGESLPIEKGPGDSVYGATINGIGTFTFRAHKVGAETLLANVIRMVEEAQISKAPVQRTVDVVASYFVPAVLTIAFAAFILWYALGPAPSLSYALMTFVAVLIVACPCALACHTNGHCRWHGCRCGARRPHSHGRGIGTGPCRQYCGAR